MRYCLDRVALQSPPLIPTEAELWANFSVSQDFSTKSIHVTSYLSSSHLIFKNKTPPLTPPTSPLASPAVYSGCSECAQPKHGEQSQELRVAFPCGHLSTQQFSLHSQDVHKELSHAASARGSVFGRPESL